MSDILKVTNLIKHYDQFTLDQINLTVSDGDITGFVGSNGAGKTTTIKAILGLISYDGGEIGLFGNTCSTSGIPMAANNVLEWFLTLSPFPTIATFQM